MKAYINAFSTGHSDYATFAVLIKENRTNKEYVYKLDNATMNAAELQAARFVLNGVHDKEKKFEIFTSNRYLLQILEADENGWVKNAVKNQDLVTSLREEFIAHKNVEIVLDKNSGDMKRAKKLSRQ